LREFFYQDEQLYSAFCKKGIDEKSFLITWLCITYKRTRRKI